MSHHLVAIISLLTFTLISVLIKLPIEYIILFLLHHSIFTVWYAEAYKGLK